MPKNYVRPEHREHSPYRNRQDILDRVKLSPDGKKVNVHLASKLKKRQASPPKMPNYADKIIKMRRTIPEKPKPRPKTTTKKFINMNDKNSRSASPLS
jgi:hypothetical protein